MSKKTIFFDVLKQELSPKLRGLGFKGSGQNFRRVKNEVVNIVNIQIDKYGGSCAVNLGLHLLFLPSNSHIELPSLAKIKEYDCEFRTRLAPHSKTDFWWKFDNFLGSPQNMARHLIGTYLEYGEPKFANFDTVEKIAAMFTLDDFKKKDLLKAFGLVTLQPGVLAMARIHQHVGNKPKAREFANFGLDNLGSATTLKSYYEDILSAT